MSNKDKKIYIVVAAYNERTVIRSVIEEIQKAGYNNIIVVDDGSKDGMREELLSIPSVVSLRHKINRGKGAATKTGIEAAKLLGADIIVTMDGDGQHDPLDISRLIEPIHKGQCEVVLGTRLKDPKGMPRHKIIQNYIGNFFTWYLFGLWVTDSQSGFRAYSKKAAHLINTRADRYEYDSEVIREIYLSQLAYKEIPIKVRYTQYSMGKEHKQNLINGMKTLFRMIWKILS